MTYKYCNTIGKGGCVTIPIEMRLSEVWYLTH